MDIKLRVVGNIDREAAFMQSLNGILHYNISVTDLGGNQNWQEVRLSFTNIKKKHCLLLYFRFPSWWMIRMTVSPILNPSSIIGLFLKMPQAIKILVRCWALIRIQQVNVIEV